MSNNFYKKVSETINKLILENNYFEALKLIEEELAMPYIPRSFENELCGFQNTINEKLYKENTKTLSFSAIIDLFYDEEKDLLVKINVSEQLNNFNLKKEVDEIFKILNNDKINYFLKIEIIKVLINQKIDFNFKLTNFNNQLIIFNPIKLKLFVDSDFYLNNVIFINETFLKYISLKESSLNMLEMIYYNLFLLDEKNILEKNISKEISFIVCNFYNEKNIQEKILESVLDKKDFQEKIKIITTLI